MPGVSRETLEPLLSPAADIDQLQAYHDLLATDGVALGLIGPREAGRLWDRHLGNSASVVVPEPGLVPIGAAVADVGSGAGLPGLVWAIVRPDLRLTLIEPLLRRSTFLDRAVDELGLSGRVEVVRDRAENLAGKRSWDVVTARAVAPLSRLLAWTVPLVAPGGVLLALKGSSAELELEEAQPVLRRLGVPPGQVAVVEVGTASPTRVVAVRRGDGRLR